MAKARIGIINVTGYIGVELARLLAHHPKVKLVSVTGRSSAGKALGEVWPHLADLPLRLEAELPPGLDIALSALPHKASAEEVVPLLKGGTRVIDLSADFRLKDPREYERWYGVAHPAPHLLEEAAFGLPELYRRHIASARLVACPGCYPTSAILALAPACKEGIIGGDIIIDSKSGVSGAGRGLSLGTHYAEVNENLSAYGLGGHRHLPEITQELKKLRPKVELRVTFLPHLAPMTRGILSTCYADLVPGKLRQGEKGLKDLRELYLGFYQKEPFVRVVADPPQTKHTWGNNYCLLYPYVDLRTGRLIVISCLDNLVKGGAGQGVQCMNLMLGLPETAGLEAPAIYP